MHCSVNVSDIYFYFISVLVSEINLEGIVDIIVKVACLKLLVSVIRNFIDKLGTSAVSIYVVNNLCRHRVHLGIKVIYLFRRKSSLFGGYTGKLLLYYLYALLRGELINLVKQSRSSRKLFELCYLVF